MWGRATGDECRRVGREGRAIRGGFGTTPDAALRATLPPRRCLARDAPTPRRCLVAQPLETHFEWVSFFHYANFASVRRLLDDERLRAVPPPLLPLEGAATSRFTGWKEPF